MSNNMDQTLIADDGCVLYRPKPHALLPLMLPISPADIVCYYPAESSIDYAELMTLVRDRLALGVEVAAQDLAALKVPDKFLFAGWCIDVRPRDGEDPDEAWRQQYASLRAKHAAELAVRRELRDKKIRVRRWPAEPSEQAKRSGIAFNVERNGARQCLPGVQFKARELCAAAGRDPDELPLPVCDAGIGGWLDFVVPAMEALGLTDADIGPEWVEFTRVDWESVHDEVLDTRIDGPGSWDWKLRDRPDIFVEMQDAAAPVVTEDQDNGKVELREAILDEVIKIYHRAAADAGWTETPPDIAEAMDDIFLLVSRACGIKDGQ